ncbi:hypothetical protein [Roseisolibacter sp. H3M3-2]|uniref:hypothetical protein n=1 Tax=Roseisolibacter sp. H3M3-2 TaxID=3031323 RepID=UPI0023DBEF8A|nr:hypothetical protein [Roseisolibacter sp. H3M3-2]MDF1501334.1 hypothetical protein [Roseisolibacter sp. H3M3-2]
MAELHIERKERSAWPWVLAGALLLALLLWYLFARDGADRVAVDLPDATTSVSAGAVVGDGMGAADLPAEVSELVRFTETRAADGAGPAHDYTAAGLRHLAAALGAVGGSTAGNVDVQARIAEIRQHADAMQRDPASTEHALQTREAFLVASSLMQQMQQGRGDAAVGAVREAHDAATAIEARTRLLDQTQRVERFFDRSANAVRELARSR